MRRLLTQASRAIALTTGAFYVVVGGWAFAAPESFFSSVATFPPYNQHLLHDAGAFQVGLGAILVLGAVRQETLRWAFLAVLVASLLHLISHIEDRGLGGHATDLPALALLCVVLAAGMFISPGVVRKEAGR
jgi:hypothetical protein